MFTGLVEEIGVIQGIERGTLSARIRIQAQKVLNALKIGDSVSTNGICLTVVEFDSKSFTVDVMPETMKRTNLYSLRKGSKVNLERALRVGDRLGGHIVTGHIDGVGVLQAVQKDENASWLTIEASSELLKYIIHKGSVAIDGTSLTVAKVQTQTFQVSIIPLTGEETTLLTKKIGDKVNIECDMVGKYIEKFTSKEENPKKTNIDMDFLSQHGFM